MKGSPSTLANLLRDSLDKSDSIFSIFPEQDILTFSSHYWNACCVANCLQRKWALKKGSRVAVFSETSSHLLAALSGCWLVGAVVCPIDPSAGYSLLNSILGDLNPDLILLSESISGLSVIKKLLRGHMCPQDSLLDISNWEREDTVQDPESDQDPESNAPALVIYTSGTTGKPKGVLLSHAALLAGANNVISAKSLSEKDRALCTLPLSHLNGLVTTYLSPLLSQGSVVFNTNPFIPSQVIETIDRYECTWMSSVPTQIASLLRPPIASSEWTLSSLKFCRSASASLSPLLRRQFEDHYGVPVIETMGMTETAGQIFSNPVNGDPRPYGSVGLPIGYEARVVDSENNPLADEEEGEIQVRGSALMTGYLNDPGETSKAFSESWLKTGDLGKRDKNGYFYITGRIKDIAIFAGINLSLSHLEYIRYSLDSVRDLAFAIEKDEIFGERLSAYVVLEDSSQVNDSAIREIKDRILEELPNAQALKEIHFVSHIPRTSVGKPRRGLFTSITPIFSWKPEFGGNARELLATILDIPVESVQEDFSIGCISQWDSLAHTGLFIAVESILGRPLKESEFRGLLTFKGIQSLLDGTFSPENIALDLLRHSENPELLSLMEMNNAIIFSRDSQDENVESSAITKSDIVDALRSAGIQKGDVVMIHSDIAALGPTVAGVKRTAVLQLFLTAFKEVLSDTGTLLTCTSFEDYARYGVPFIRESSPSRLGAFSEHIRKQKDSVRSIHPIVSICGIGPAASAICKGPHYDGFGYDSAWGRLHRAGAKLMTLGMSKHPTFGMTFIHYIEQLYGVPYQYNKLYDTPVFSDGIELKKQFTMSVRYLDYSITYDTNPFKNHLLDKKHAIQVPLGLDAVLAVDSTVFVEQGIKLLRANRNAFLLKPPTYRPGEIPTDGNTGKLRYLYDKGNKMSNKDN